MLKRSFLAAAVLAAFAVPACLSWCCASAGKVERLHAQCVGCHGIPDYKTAFPEVYHVPKIAGQQPGYIAAALKEYRSGARSHPSMRGVAASLDDQEIEQLAKYYGAPAK